MLADLIPADATEPCQVLVAHGEYRAEHRRVHSAEPPRKRASVLGPLTTLVQADLAVEPLDHHLALPIAEEQPTTQAPARQRIAELATSAPPSLASKQHELDVLEERRLARFVRSGDDDKSFRKPSYSLA